MRFDSDPKTGISRFDFSQVNSTIDKKTNDKDPHVQKKSSFWIGSFLFLIATSEAIAINRSQLVAYYSFDSVAFVNNSTAIDELMMKGSARPIRDLSRSKLGSASASTNISGFFSSVNRFSLVNEYCLNAWVYLNSTSGDPTFFSGNSTTAACGTPNNFIYTSTNDLYGRFGNGIGGWDADIAPSGISTGSWNMVTSCWSGGGSGKLYVNGVELTSATASCSTMNASHFNFMAYTNGGSIPDGNIDEVSVWRHLSSLDISELYNTGAGLSYSAIVGSTYQNPIVIEENTRINGGHSASWHPNGAVIAVNDIGGDGIALYEIVPSHSVSIDTTKLKAHYSFDHDLTHDVYGNRSLTIIGSPVLDLNHSKKGRGSFSSNSGTGYLRSLDTYGLNNSFCLNAWVRLNSTAGDPTFYSGNSTTPGCGAPNTLLSSSGPTLYGRFGNGSGGWDSQTAPWSPSLSEWQMVTACWNASGTAKVYVNAIEKTSTSVSCSSLASSYFTFFSYVNGSSVPNGSLDELSVWSNLNTSEIAALYNSGRGLSLSETLNQSTQVQLKEVANDYPSPSGSFSLRESDDNDFSALGNLAVVAKDSDALAVYSYDTSTRVLTLLDYETSTSELDDVRAVNWHPDGDRLFTASYSTNGGILAVYQFNPASGALTYQNKVVSPTGIQGLYELAVNPSGDRIALVGRTNHSIAVYAYDKATGSLTLVASLTTNTHLSNPLDVKFNFTGDRLAVVNDAAAGTLSIFAFDKSLGTLSHELELMTPDVSGGHTVDWSPVRDELAIAAYRNHSATIYSYDRSAPSLTPTYLYRDTERLHEIRGIRWSSDGSRLSFSNYSNESIAPQNTNVGFLER